MADSSTQGPSKKSGFSFRRKRSRSRSRKEDEAKSINCENVQENSVIAKNNEQYEGGKEEMKTAQSETSPSIEDEVAAKGTTSSGKDASPKGVKNHELPPEGSTKKKSKRRSRSLFRRTSGKEAKSGEETCEMVGKETEPQDEMDKETEVKTSEPFVNDSDEQVVYDQSNADEVRDQSDVEGAGNVSGEASEIEGEGDEKASENQNKETEVRPNETAAENEDKGGGQKEKTKKKGFFKRGLSLRRSKSSKKQDVGESTTEKVTAKDFKSQCETEESAELEQEANLTQSDANEVNNSSIVNETNVSQAPDEQKTDESELESDIALAKKAPPKPARKVSFYEPEGTAVGSFDEGDSPGEQPVETGIDLEDTTPPATSEVIPSKDIVAEPQAVAEEKIQPITEAEVPAVSEQPTFEVDEDTLTEVSSISSSMLASSEGPSQFDTDDSRLYMFTDTDDTASQITLVIKSEADLEKSEPPTEEKCEPSGEEKSVSKVEESRSKKDSEVETLLGGNSTETKDGEWEMLHQSYDVSVELQRVRKHTLLGVKQLCCSVM